jgi:hypothetical protein
MLAIKYPLFVSASLLVLLAASAAAQGPPVVTPPVAFTRNYNFPPVGLAGTETLQVNVVNLSLFTATPFVTGTASCTSTISFANASGMAIGAPVKFTIGSGQIYSAPLPFSKTGYSSRGEILASVQQAVEISSAGACSLAISLETFDTSTGVTHAILTAPATTPGALFSVITPGMPGRP